jgi:hypothetical protein
MYKTYNLIGKIKPVSDGVFLIVIFIKYSLLAPAQMSIAAMPGM